MNRADLAVILAAGHGTRMQGSVSKPLRTLAGLTMLEHVAKASLQASRSLVIVVSESILDVCSRLLPDASFVVQQKAAGTGDAAKIGLLHALDLGMNLQRVLFINGDSPLIKGKTLRRLTSSLDDQTSLVVLGFHRADPHGYGRIVFKVEGKSSSSRSPFLDRIIEENDCIGKQSRLSLCSAGAFAARAEGLLETLSTLKPHSASKECRLSDLAACLSDKGVRVYITEGEEGLGVNTCTQLAEAEKVWQQETRASLLQRGVLLKAPNTVFLSHDTKISPEAIIDPYVVIGNDVSIGRRAHIHSFSHIVGAHIAVGASVGPFARLRTGSYIGKKVKIGNFVETKNARFGTEAKASHLSYLGDCDIGAEANIGAGVITCNYDGVRKHKTKIGAQSFIGSNSSLIAPLSVGARAVVGASSAVSRNVPAEALVIERSVLQEKPKGATRMRLKRQALEKK